MKFALPLILLIVAFSTNACTTLANRRDLYYPDKPSGPYVDRLAEQNQADIDVMMAHNRPKNH